jgi:hypothetical protein
MPLRISLAFIVLFMTVTFTGCNRRPSTNNASSEVDVRAVPPVTELNPGPVTAPASRPYIPSGRAVTPETPDGPVTIHGTGPGSPGTR